MDNNGEVRTDEGEVVTDEIADPPAGDTTVDPAELVSSSPAPMNSGGSTGIWEYGIELSH